MPIRVQLVSSQECFYPHNIIPRSGTRYNAMLYERGYTAVSMRRIVADEMRMIVLVLTRRVAFRGVTLTVILRVIKYVKHANGLMITCQTE